MKKEEVHPCWEIILYEPLTFLHVLQTEALAAFIPDNLLKDGYTTNKRKEVSLSGAKAKSLFFSVT